MINKTQTELKQITLSITLSVMVSSAITHMHKYNINVEHIYAVHLAWTTDVMVCFCLAGIEKLTEKSQVSQDGTMVALQERQSSQTQADQGAGAGASDTESNSGRENEVRDKSEHNMIQVCFVT